jgi:hypothetical protein
MRSRDPSTNGASIARQLRHINGLRALRASEGAPTTAPRRLQRRNDATGAVMFAVGGGNNSHSRA